MPSLKSYIPLLAALILLGCNSIAPIDNPQPSVYFWKTIFDPDSTEKAFINDFGIRAFLS